MQPRRPGETATARATPRSSGRQANAQASTAPTRNPPTPSLLERLMTAGRRDAIPALALPPCPRNRAELRSESSFAGDAFERVFQKSLAAPTCPASSRLCAAARAVSASLGASSAARTSSSAAARKNPARASTRPALRLVYADSGAATLTQHRVACGAQERRQSLVCGAREALQGLSNRLGRLAALPRVEPQLCQREPRRRGCRVKSGRLPTRPRAHRSESPTAARVRDSATTSATSKRTGPMTLLPQPECSLENRRPAASQQELRLCGVGCECQQGGSCRSDPQTAQRVALARRELPLRDAPCCTRFGDERKALRSRDERQEKCNRLQRSNESSRLGCHRSRSAALPCFTQISAPCNSRECSRGKRHSRDMEWKVDQGMTGHGDQTRRGRKCQWHSASAVSRAAPPPA